MEAFDRHARHYRTVWDEDPVARVQRGRVHARIEALLGGRTARILDLGCGTGTDAALLADRGHTVVGVDPSEGMLAVAREQCQARSASFEVGDLRGPFPPGPFDLVLSDFGALNCAPVDVPWRRLAEVTTAGTPVVAVYLARTAPFELASLLIRGELRKMRTRRRDGVADVEGRPVRVWFPTTDELRRACDPWFTIESAEGLGAALPPPGPLGRRLHGLVPWLAPLDARLGPHTTWGDHVLYVIRRTACGIHDSPPR